MAPETHTRYRVQRLIRLGEWLERNQAALQLAIEVIDEAHDVLVDPPEDMPCSDQCEMAGFKMMSPMAVLNRLRSELLYSVPVRDVQMGKDVTLRHPYGEKEFEVVMKAPVADVPTHKREYESMQEAMVEADRCAAKND